MALTSAHTTSELGHMYSDGHGFPKDEAHAQDLYEGARAAGDANAAFNLGHARGRRGSKPKRSS